MAILPGEIFVSASVTSSDDGQQADPAAFGPREQALAALNEMRKEAADQVARANLRIELDDATDLNGLREVEQRFEATRAANAKAFFVDPVIGEQWLQAEDQEARRLIDVRAAELTREREIGQLDGWLNGLRESALQVSDPDTARLIGAGANLIDRAQAAGVFDAATAKARQQHWVQSYATAWTEMRPPEERLVLLGEGLLGDMAAPAVDEATGGLSRNTGTPADFIPPEERDRIRREAQVELDRNRTQRLWQRSQHHSQGIEQALQGVAAPPLRAVIETDPDLDELSRTRLLRQHAAMERELAAYAQFKARFDNPAGGAFDIHDANDRGFADKTYRRLGATPAALHAVVSRTGILPASALTRMQGDVASDDPARVTQAVDRAMRLGRDHPRLLALEDDSEDVQNAAAQFRLDTGRGATRDQAIRRIIQVQSSEYQKAWAARRTHIDLDAEVANTISPADLAHLPRTDPLVTAVALSVYPHLVKERFEATGDIALAKAQARDQLELLARAADEEGGGDGGGGGGDGTSNEAADAMPPESSRPKTRITVWPRWVILPDSGQSDGSERPVASHQAAASASENVEALRVEPPVDELEELGPQPAPAQDRIGTEALAPERPVVPPSQPVQTAPARAEIEQPASTQPEPEPGPPIVSLEDREKFSTANAEFRGTIQGAAKLNQWATTKQWLEANPNATDEQLLAKFTPGLLRTRWAERRQATVNYLRDAPRLHDEARANLDRYDAMPSARTIAEFVASLRGELYVAATSSETLLGGGSAKGATWLLRALKTALREAGTAAVTDSIRQWQNIEAGLQEKFDGTRTAVSAGFAGVFGAASNAGIDAARMGIKAKFPGGGKKAAPGDKNPSAPQSAATNEVGANRQPLTLSGEFLSEPAQKKLLQRLIPDYSKQAAKVKELLGASDWNVPLPLAIAIRHYTGEIYKQLNKALREGNITPDHKNLAAMIVEGLGRARKYQGEIWRAPDTTTAGARKLWDAAAIRGADFDLGYQFQSFTLDKTRAASWSKDAKLVVHIRNSRSGVYIADFSHIPSQQEVLLPPGLKYKVVGRREERVRDSAVRVIKLEIVDAK